MPFPESKLRSEYRTEPSDIQRHRLAQPEPIGKSQVAGGGWFLPLIISYGLNAIGDYFTTKSQMEGEERRAAYSRETQLMLQRMRDDAARELDREKRRLPDWAYRQLKGIVTAPLMPHGGGAPPGSFQQAVTPKTPTPMGTPGQTPTPMAGGGQFASQVGQRPPIQPSPIFRSRMPAGPSFGGG